MPLTAVVADGLRWGKALTMQFETSHNADRASQLAFWLLAAFLAILWFAGGASRADVLGQAICRFFAWTILAVWALWGGALQWKPLWPLYAFQGLAVLGAAVQMIPLPPELWSALPGHAILLGAAEVSGQAQPWRPISIAPSSTANALSSLVVPATVLILGTSLSQRQQWRIAILLLGMVLAGSLMAVVQASGAGVVSPLINTAPASVSGNFSNRNHLALFVAAGCLLALLVGTARDRVPRMVSIGALLLLPFFILVVLAVGSRIGVVLALLAVPAALMLVRKDLYRIVRAWPRRLAISLGFASAAGIVAAVSASIYLGRATALERAFEIEASEDLRGQALQYVLNATERFFPAGSGFGTFDQAYRIEEPYELLRLTYFNHAHNDWLETVLTGGALGALILFLFVGWYGFAVSRLWRRRHAGPRLAAGGAVILLLFVIASLFDYPARTPLGMALVTIAAIWLQRGAWTPHDLNIERRP